MTKYITFALQILFAMCILAGLYQHDIYIICANGFLCLFISIESLNYNSCLFHNNINKLILYGLEKEQNELKRRIQDEAESRTNDNETNI